jgi:GNAT superfamily N-acetyltransferase
MDVGSTVRMATGDDIESITKLVNLAYRVEDFFVEGDRTSAAEIERLSEDGFFLVLDGADGLSGAVYVRIDGDRGYFGLLSVDPNEQGTGLGRRLVAVAEAMCQAEGCSRMELQVVNLRTELPPWYRRLGYRDAGTAPFPSDAQTSRDCHFIKMTKPL